MSNGLYPNNTLDLSNYNNKINFNPLENFNTNSPNQIASSISNQNLNIFPFNFCNNSKYLLS